METAKQEFVNDRQASTITGIAVQTYRNWRQNKKGPAYVKIGSSVRYSISDLRAFMEARRIEPSAGN
jgi:hypothetical protein